MASPRGAFKGIVSYNPTLLRASVCLTIVKTLSGRKRGLSTKGIHGMNPQKAGPAVVPVTQTSTFVFENQKEVVDAVTGKSRKDVYTRWSNPTSRNVEEKMSALENTEASLLLSSGMAAISSTILGLVKSGDSIISSDSIYGGTFHFFHRLSDELGIQVDLVDNDAFVDRIADSSGQYKIAYFETPTNPTLRIVDIKGVADAAQAAGSISVIDNTFATPINQRPSDLGIDVVLHSATKYIGGHSDLIAGTVSTRQELIEKIHGAAKLYGGTADPFMAFLVDRGLKTLAVRVERHNWNAMYLAQKLERDSRIRRVHYPGLTSHPHHNTAKKQMSGFGGMLSVDLDCCLEDAIKFVDSLEIFLNAVSLGGVESLASIPALTTHYGVDPEVMAETGISPSTVRLSVGIEDAEDLYFDIINTLENSLG